LDAALPLPDSAPPENDSASSGSSGTAPSPAPPAGLLDSLTTLWQRAAHALVPVPRAARPPPGAKRRALRLFLRAASQGNAVAELAVGDAYFYGRGGLPVSLPDAVERYHTACANHVPEVRSCDRVAAVARGGEGGGCLRELACAHATRLPPGADTQHRLQLTDPPLLAPALPACRAASRWGRCTRRAWAWRATATSPSGSTT
jgi:TPR repeat protein